MAIAMFSALPVGQVFAEGEIIKIDVQSSTELESTGGNVSVELITGGVTNENVDVVANLNGERINIPFTVEGEKARKIINLEFPENTTSENQVYNLHFLADKNDESSRNGDITVTVKGKEKDPTPVVNEFIAKDNIVPLEGKKTSISIKGENLDLGMFTFKTYLKDGNNLSEIKFNQTNFEGIDSIKTASLTIPATDKNRTIVVKLLEKGEEVAQLEINQEGEEAESLNYAPFIPKNTYLSGNDLIIEYQSPISEVIEGKLKENIAIDFAGTGNFEKLGPNDSARIESNKIIISLVDKLPVFENGAIPRIRFNKGTFKTDDGFANDGSGNIIIKKSGTPVVSDGKIVKGYLLDSQGGEVEIEINGDHLDENKTKVKVLKSNKLSLDENGEDTRIIDPSLLGLVVEGNGKNQKIKFNAPANTSDNTQSYIVMVAVDGTRFSSELSSAGKEVKDKLVVSVLPADKDSNEPTLSYMTIQSYGSQGGGTEAPDNTHTEPPLSQGSKKTLVHVYGTNLDPSLTKIRFKDQNGVYWYPSNDAGKGAQSFTMVMMDNNTGMTGGGNSLLMEVIMPNGYSEDMLFTYEVAVDGKNYDEETTVTAFLKAPTENKVANAPGITEQQKSVLVKHQDENGKSIGQDKTYKIMTNIPLSQTEIGMVEPIAIDGYDYLHINGYEDNPHALKMKIGDRDELILVYKNLNPGEESKEDENPNKDQEKEEDKTPPKGNEDSKVDQALKELIKTDLDKLTNLSSTERKDYKEKIDKASSNIDIYKHYNDAQTKHYSRVKSKPTIVEIPKVEKEYIYIPSRHSKVTVEKSPNIAYIKDDYIYVPEGYEFIKEGYYKKDELYKKYYRLRKSMYDNDIMVKSAEFLLENTPKTVASVRDKLLYQIQKSNKLQDRANKSAREYEQILGL